MTEKSVAVIGGSAGTQSKEVVVLAQLLGGALARRNINVVTGAGPGLPAVVAYAAKENGGKVFGVSPSEQAPFTFAQIAGVDPELLSLYGESAKRAALAKDPYDYVTYTGLGDAGRSVALVRGVDAVISLGGGPGTFHEVAIANKDGKIVGVLEGTGGITDRLRELEPLLRGSAALTAEFVYSRDPIKLAEKVEFTIDARIAAQLAAIKKEKIKQLVKARQA